MSSKLKNTVKRLVQELGYYGTKKMMGISYTELAKLSGERISYDLAYEILIEGIGNKTIPTEYKEFKLRRSFDSIIYWGAKIKTGRFSPDITEHIDVVATPFWDGGESTPVELDWYALVKDKSEKAIVETFGHEENYFVQLTDITSFKDVNYLFRWYEGYYLPTVYEIITTNYIPKAQQICEHKLDEKFGPSSITEDKKRNQGQIKFDESQLKAFNLILTKKLKGIIKDFKKVDIEEVVYNESSNYFTSLGKIYFDEDWIYSQYRKYNYSKPLPPYDELSFGEIMSNEDPWYKDLNKIFRMAFTSIMGTLEPKYTSYSWLTAHPIEEETTNLQEQIRKALKEETDKAERFDNALHKFENIMNNIKFEAVKKIGLDYNEMFDSIDVNIFWDRDYAIQNHKKFNRVRRESGNEIKSYVEGLFPNKYLFYDHYE